MVWKWYKKFQKSRTDMHGNVQSGRPLVITEDLVHATQEKILHDRRIKIDNVCVSFSHGSRGTMFVIVRHCLGYGKLCARWVSTQLSNDHMSKWSTSLDLLTHYSANFLDKMIICDEILDELH